MKSRAIIVLICLAMAVSGCSTGKSNSQENSIQKELLSKIEQLQDANGLEIYETQKTSATMKYYKNKEIVEIKELPQEILNVERKIDLEQKDKIQYQIHMVPENREKGAEETLLQLKDEILSTYVVDDNKYEKLQEKKKQSLDAETFLSSMLYLDDMRTAENHFHFQKEDRGRKRLYTAELNDTKKFVKYLKEKNHNQKDIEFHEMKLEYVIEDSGITEVNIRIRNSISNEVQNEKAERISSDNTIVKGIQIKTLHHKPEFIEPE